MRKIFGSCDSNQFRFIACGGGEETTTGTAHQVLLNPNQ